MISLVNGYLQLSGLGVVICSLHKTWRHIHDLAFSGFQLSCSWLGWTYSHFSSSGSSLVLELRAPHWAGSQESTEAAELPPPKTQDIPNQFDYSFAWNLLGPFEPKWLSCFTDGFFQIHGEGKKINKEDKVENHCCNNRTSFGYPMVAVV